MNDMMKCREIKNKKLYNALKKKGYEGIILIKADGYFYLDTEDSDVYYKYRLDVADSIYFCHFNQYSIDEWVEEIERILCRAINK